MQNQLDIAIMNSQSVVRNMQAMEKKGDSDMWIIIILGVIVFLAILSRKKSTRITNQKSMVDEISAIAKSSGTYYSIMSSVQMGDMHESVIIMKNNGLKERYGFKEHNFEYLSYDGMVNLFNALAKNLNGSVEIKYKTVYGRGSDTITSVSEGFTPGGGSGYYANTVGGADCAKVPVEIRFYCEKATQQRKEIQDEKKQKNQQLRKSF